MIQHLSIIALAMLSTLTVAAQKPNTKHCFKLNTETDLFDGSSTTTMGGLKYQMSMLTFHKHVAKGDTTLMVGATLTAQGYETDPGMIFLFDDGSRLEIPESTHKASAASYGWNHVGIGVITEEELQQFAEKSVKAFRLGRYDQETPGKAGKSVSMTSAYCLANHR